MYRNKPIDPIEFGPYAMTRIPSDYVQWCADNKELQAIWAREPWGKPLKSNIHPGDRFFHGDVAGVARPSFRNQNQISLIANRLLTIGFAGSYFTYYIANDIGGHCPQQRHKDFVRYGWFKWIPTLEQLVALGIGLEDAYRLITGQVPEHLR
jgi:hypothetical protein